jgi:putative ABC transport system permease protein
MHALLDDLRLALRPLRRSPGFTFTAILTLALGIGATTAIFTLVYDVLLRPLPYSNPEQLVMMEEVVAEFKDIYPTLPMSANHFTTWQRLSQTVQAMAVMEQNAMPLGTGGHPQQVEVLSATPGIFPVVGSTPQLGRAFVDQEAQPGHEHVAILMNDLWRSQFQSDRAILGKTITLNGFPYTVIGVMPRSFHLPIVRALGGAGSQGMNPIGAIVPLAFSKERLGEANGEFNSFGLARLKPGVSVKQASAEINALQRTISAGLSAEDKSTLSAVLTPFQQALVGTNRTPLVILLAAVAGLLLVGCVNITNLLLARAAGRRQQMAVAAALGANRGDMLHLAMRETTVLAISGGALGILLAAILVPLMQRYLPLALNFRGPLHLDWMGAACALGLSVLSTLLAGAAPAWISARTQPHEVLNSESHLASESRSSKRMRRILVAVEVAVSVTLVLMTGLLTASMVRLMNTDRGFAAERVVTAQIDLPKKSYADNQPRFRFYKELLQRLHSVPGLEQAAVVSILPLAGDEWIDMIRVSGDARPMMQLPTQHFRWTSPDYFEALHLPLIAGRFLTAGDEGKSYALVSDLTARTMWPGKNPIGQQFRRGGNPDEPAFTVIGVVGNARTVSLAKPDPMMVYAPYWYRCDNTAGLVLRAHAESALIADAVRKAVWSVDPDVSVPVVRTLGGVIADSLENRRFEMDLLMLFAISALLLAGLGVYGVVTYSVVQRKREIGLRLALGAQRANIYRLVMRDGLVPVLAGTAIGIAVAFVAARVVANLFFQVSPYNPAIVTGTIALLLSVGVAACLVPARRAASIDPMRALRTDQ